MPRRKQDKPKHCDESSEGENTIDMECSKIDNDKNITNFNTSAAHEEEGNGNPESVEQRIDVDSLPPEEDTFDDEERVEVDDTVDEARLSEEEAEQEKGKEKGESVEEITKDEDQIMNSHDVPNGLEENIEVSEEAEETADSESESVKSADIPSFDCTKCAAILPSSELLLIHMMSHQPATGNASNQRKGEETTSKSSIFGGPQTNSSNSVAYPPTLIDGNDSMEEYMEIQKPENPHLEHLIKLEGQISDPNQCLICERVLSCKSALMMHYRTHTGERPFRCKLCSRAFTTKGNLKTHMSVHRAKPAVRLLHNCPICNKQFTNALVLNQHMRLHSEEVNQPRKRSVGSAGSTDLPSLGDPKKFRIGGEYGSEKEAITQLANPFQFMFGPLPNIQDHFRYADALARQWDQLSQFSLFPSLATVGFPGSFPSLPNPSAMAMPSFREQLNLHLPKTLDVRRESVLSIPTSVSKEESRLLKNEPKDLTVNEFVPAQRLSSTTSPRSERSCGSRGSGETNTSAARIDPPPGTACDICSKVFACRSALEIHYRSHTKQRPFKCELCDKAFTTRGNMKQHMLTHKSDDLAWGSFGQSHNPNLLASAIGLEDPLKGRGNKHICNVCNKNFSSASAVQIHFRTHTGDRPFKCSVCGKAFTTKGNLKVHMGTHMWNTPSRSSLDEANEQHVKTTPSPPTPSATSSHNYPAMKPENNNLLWAGLSSQALMKASSFFGNPTAMYPYSRAHSAPTGSSAANEVLTKPWLWRVTCHLCNKECSSPAALELHIQTHVGVDNPSNKPVTA